MQNNKEILQNKIYKELQQKYNRMAISKSEMSNELGVSNSTLDLYISKREGLPNFKKLGTAKNARVIFNLIDVANFLADTKQISSVNNEPKSNDNTATHNKNKAFNLEENDYRVASTIYHLSNNPQSEFKGWFFDKIETLENLLLLDKEEVLHSVKTLIDKKLIVKDETTGFLKITSLWWNSFSGCKL